jgi:mono/diheme cytochrome c family protein
MAIASADSPSFMGATVKHLNGTIKLIAFVFLVFLSFSSLYQSCSPVHNEKSLSQTSQSSLNIYKQTLYPLVSGNCAACHGAQQNPLFAVNDPGSSHNVLLNSQLVSLPSPDQSLLVRKISGGHSGIPVNLSNDLRAAITEWSRQLGSLDDQSDPSVKATFSYIQQNILVPKCLPCHSPGGRRPQTDYSNYSTTLSTGKVTAGDAQASQLYTQCFSQAMPINGAVLNASELNGLRDWINAGALEN